MVRVAASTGMGNGALAIGPKLPRPSSTLPAFSRGQTRSRPESHTGGAVRRRHRHGRGLLPRARFGMCLTALAGCGGLRGTPGSSAAYNRGFHGAALSRGHSSPASLQMGVRTGTERKMVKNPNDFRPLGRNRLLLLGGATVLALFLAYLFAPGGIVPR